MLLGSPGVTIVDVNVPDIYAEGHVPGAVHLAGPDVLAVLPKDKSRRAIFYCYSRRCSASHEAAAQAISLGYRNVFVMKDGIVGWRRAGKRLEGGAPSSSLLRER